MEENSQNTRPGSRGKVWIIPAAILVLMASSAMLAPWIAPQNPYKLEELRLEDGGLAPPWTERGQAERAEGVEHERLYILGSDRQGRDILSAVLFGLRVSLLVGVVGTLLALLIGTTIGLTSGYFGGLYDTIVMRIADIQLSFPSVLIALFLMAIWGKGVGKIILAVTIVNWVLFARVIRGAVLAEREKDYVAAIENLGARSSRILIAHLLPNVASSLLVLSAIQFARIVMLEATLSFLGLGVPRMRPSLGMLIQFGYEEFFSGQWWIWFFPGVTLVILVIAINWLADILRGMIELKS